MTRIFEKIVDHPKLIISVFLIAAVVCGVCRQFVAVDYDMNDYLPEESPSTVALDTMQSEYSGGIPNARVMVSDVTISETLEYKKKIEAVDGVTEVTWLDDRTDITMPQEIMDDETMSKYYKDGNALFTVTIESDKRLSAVSDIRGIVGDNGRLAGSAVSTAAATEQTVKEIPKIAVLAILFTLFILAVTTTSWAEPLLVLAGLGVAVVINAGSNLIFGEISFVTNAAGSILQLAVSLDYSVFLLHRFEEIHETEPDPKKSMVEALTQSVSSIMASGLTTVIGFLALCLMRFRIGPDLGLALAKGVAISLITVFVFMPVFILAVYRWILQFRHRPLMPSFAKFGRLITRIMIPVVCIFVLAIVPAFKASNANSFYYGASHIFGTDTRAGADREKITQTFGEQDTYVLMIPRDSNKSDQKQLVDDIEKLPHVTGVISYAGTVGTQIPDEILPSQLGSQLDSNKYTRMVISVEVPYEGDETFSLVKDIRKTAAGYFPDGYMLAGEGVSTYDLMDTVTADMMRVNLIAIAAVFLVLLVTMRSVALPCILVAAIETAIWINLSVPYVCGSTIFYIAYLIISSIQLGATVDYAILFTDRYKEFRGIYEKKDAVIETVKGTAVSILTSGTVLTVAGFLMGVISSHRVLSQLGMFLGRGTLCSLGTVLFVLPGLLYLADRAIMRRSRKKQAGNV